MIKLTDGHGKHYSFQLTRFPDGTSQVNNITPEPERLQDMEVLWMFENEAELITVCQLGHLLGTYAIFPTLNMPFLVYGRQDKLISNNTTFAKIVMERLVMESGYTRILTYDAHSDNSDFIQSREPVELIGAAIAHQDVVCFPDAGAVKRYMHLIGNHIPAIYCEKVRNQITGEIEGLQLMSDDDITGKNVLVLDDLCDGGKTFIEVAKILNAQGAGELTLAISHGIFSKGINIIFDAGYKTVYTTNSLIDNQRIGNINHLADKYDISSSRSYAEHIGDKITVEVVKL